MSEAFDQLRRLAVALEAGKPLPEDVRAWWLDGVEAFIESGGRQPLDIILGLRGRGVRSWETWAAIQDRNAALVAAADHAGDTLPEEVRRFRRRWPRLAHFSEPPATLKPVERELFKAFQAHEVPEDPHYLRVLARMK